MEPKLRNILFILIGAGFFILLVLLSQDGINPPGGFQVWLLFTLIIFITTTFGIPIGGGEVSLVPVAAFTAVLTIGLVPAAWATFIADLLYGIVRHYHPK